MNNVVTAAVAMAAVVAPLAADISPDGVENWLKLGGLGVVVFILTHQLSQALKDNNDLRKQLLDAVNKCSSCPLAQAANNELIKHTKEEQ